MRGSHASLIWSGLGSTRRNEPLRLLVLEDDPRLADLLKRGLGREGYVVDVAGTIEEGRWLAGEEPYDALVLDVMLPDGDGLALCGELRARGIWSPVLFLTARDSIGDRVRGLDLGGDDYLVKPFAFEELLARLRALIRRGAPPRPAVLQVGSLELDPARHQVTVAGEAVQLSAREFALLELFVRHPGEVLTRRRVLDAVWDWANGGVSNVVDVYVRYLRLKLAGRPGAPAIEAIRGVGYVLRDVEPTRTPATGGPVAAPR